MPRESRKAPRVCLVTGGSHGIGAGIAERLVSEGAHVVISALDPDAGDSTKRALRGRGRSGQQIEFVRADVRRRADVEAAVEYCLRTFGRLDVTVASAGVGLAASLFETTDEAWDEVIGTNLTGCFLTLQIAAKAMEKQRTGRIVLVASTNAFWMETNLGAYNASKAGVVALCRTAAMELAPKGVTVNAVAPGLIATRMTLPVREQAGVRERYLSQIPMGTFGEPSDVAAAVAFLVSDDARWITGHVLVVDGGQTLGTPYEVS